MTKVDFKKQQKHLYSPSPKTFSVVDVPPMLFLMIDGHGDPNTAQAYQEAVEALYAIAYKLKLVSMRQYDKSFRGSGQSPAWSLERFDPVHLLAVKQPPTPHPFPLDSASSQQSAKVVRMVV